MGFKLTFWTQNWFTLFLLSIYSVAFYISLVQTNREFWRLAKSFPIREAAKEISSYPHIGPHNRGIINYSLCAAKGHSSFMTVTHFTCNLATFLSPSSKPLLRALQIVLLTRRKRDTATRSSRRLALAKSVIALS